MTMRARGTGSSLPAEGPGQPDVVPGVDALGVDTVEVEALGEETVQVEAAENELRRLGLAEVRVRHHGELARLEAPRTDLASMATEPLRGEVLRAVRSAGFQAVAIDLDAATDPREA